MTDGFKPGTNYCRRMRMANRAEIMLSELRATTRHRILRASRSAAAVRSPSAAVFPPTVRAWRHRRADQRVYRTANAA